MGDFSANFHRPESGIHTVEGNVAGSRAAALTKKREREQAEFESLKNKIRSDSNRERQNIDSKFDHTSNVTAAERTFRDRTVGLVSAEEFKRAAAGEGPEGEEEKSARLADEEKKKKAAEEEARRRRREKKRKRKAKKRMLSTLSFANEEDAADILAPDDDDEEEEEDGGGTTGAGGGGVGTTIRSAIHKNPEVDTSFLPDRQREMETRAERERLRAEWIELQEKIKGETLEITYSYWDGSGHRRTVRVQKGDTIAHFLELVRRDLSKDFREMGKVTSDGLLYVKEDLIIPHDISFYDLIATKARGKSGPLFNFDVHDDVRMGTIDVRVEKDESHPGKVVERRWYDRNKHIFPASRWEVFDPAKDYGRYTIHGGEVNKKKK